MHVTDHDESGRETTLRITDHTDADHRLTLDSAGTVTDHFSDRYPRGDEPTPLERERLARAERFGQYYLRRTDGVDALDPCADPDRLTVAALLLGVVSHETLVTQFEACYDQIAGERSDGEPPVSPPTTAPDAEWSRIEQDIRLTVADDGVVRVSDVVHAVDGLETLRGALDSRPDRDDADLLDRLDGLLRATGSADGDRGERFLSAADPLRVHWDTDGPTRIEYGEEADDARENTPAARLQLTPAHAPVISSADFQRTVVDHLRCQIRDCYVGMGVRPPRDVQLTGPGRSACTDRYEALDVLQNYHDEHAIVDWEQLAPRPEL